MPNIRIQNTSPNIRNKNTFPNARISAGSQSVTTTTPGAIFGGKGYPIGILLAITADRSHQVSSTSSTTGGLGIGPNVRITNI